MTNNELLDSDGGEGLDALLKKKYQHKTSLMAFQNLATFPFNKRANKAISSGGWYVISGVAVDAFAGDDVIIGFSSVENVGIEIVGSLDAGSGDDLIVGEGVGDCGIYNFGALAGGSGNDTMRGIGKEIGIVNVGSIDLGNGKDVIQGSGGQGTTEQGIRNEGSIMGGSGSDTIKGKGRADLAFSMERSMQVLTTSLTAATEMMPSRELVEDSGSKILASSMADQAKTPFEVRS